MRRERYNKSTLVPLELPEPQAQELERTFEVLSRDLHPEPDYDYPPHDEEAFQEGYPRKGGGGYGSSSDF